MCFRFSEKGSENASPTLSSPDVRHRLIAKVFLVPSVDLIARDVWLFPRYFVPFSKPDKGERNVKAKLCVPHGFQIVHAEMLPNLLRVVLNLDLVHWSMTKGAAC